MGQNNAPLSSRAASLARRKAMSSMGKAALQSGNERTRSAPAKPAVSTPAVTPAPRAAAPSPAVSAAASSAAATAVSPARSAALERRIAMSTRGKAAVKTTDRVRSETISSQTTPVASQVSASESKRGCGCGCDGTNPSCQGKMAADAAPAAPAPSAAPILNNGVRPKAKAMISPGRAASRARRAAMSSRGKAGIHKGGMSAAQTARAANPELTGRELAKALREQRSTKGKCGPKSSEPCGRRRKAKPNPDASLKVGVSETSTGQSVTGTMVGRSLRTTGDEPSTCRTVTGTEYMGADVFRQFCQTDPSKPVRKVAVTSTGHGNSVTGTEVGRSERVTGDEPGSCHRVTGNQYVGAENVQAFCGTKPEPVPPKVMQAQTTGGRSVTGSNVGRSAKVTGDEVGASRSLTGTQYMESGDGAAPSKVGSSQTTRGGSITGTLVGRSASVTGDEPGSCKLVTGDDYISLEQYESFCETKPSFDDQKVGFSLTQQGRPVSGTMANRGGKVTGNEPGTCHAITGTPYAGAEQYKEFCDTDSAQRMQQRTRPAYQRPGSVMTGIQPGTEGLTGAQRGECESVSGTPYQSTEQCDIGHNFPAEESPFDDFSVSGPSHAAANRWSGNGVTGTRYEQGKITGPFGMAEDKVTGTEEFRFDRKAPAAPAPQPTAAEQEEMAREKSRITGEGMDVGPKITGDDWNRGDRVTGTEGMSATRRNPTLRQGMNTVMPPAREPKRNEEVPAPVSKVTGSSGNSERGSLVTYSGGARG